MNRNCNDGMMGKEKAGIMEQWNIGIMGKEKAYKNGRIRNKQLKQWNDGKERRWKNGIMG